jgi:hypothetical protein
MPLLQKASFSVFVALFTVLGVETVAQCARLWRGKDLLPNAELVLLQAGGDELESTPGGRNLDTSILHPFPNFHQEALHPYLGFVLDPAINSDKITLLNRSPISEHGLLDHGSPVRKKAADRVLVGVFGASYAYHMSIDGAAELTRSLESSPALAGRRVEFVRIALGGYKQPQQLLALSYFLSLGAEFDIVINLDGFNEVVLPPTDNLIKGTFPFYPRNWYLRVQDLADTELRLAIGEVAVLKRQRKNWASRFLSVRHSLIAGSFWRFWDVKLQLRIAERQMALQTYLPHAGDFVATGPSVKYATPDTMYDELVTVWLRSSVLMSRLCAANGIRYYHFLQPNQYLPGSKPMSHEERRVSLADHLFRRHAEAGYPRLRKAGAEMGREGVRYRDLTMIFADVDDQLYIDTCCHVNARGSEITARAIGRAIREDLENTPREHRRTPDSVDGADGNKVRLKD